MSRRSRNHHVGEQLGRGRSLDEVLDEMTMVAEGVKSAPAVLEPAHRAEVAVPICKQVAAVLFEGRRPEDAVDELMSRDRRTSRNDVRRVAAVGAVRYVRTSERGAARFWRFLIAGIGTKILR